MFASRTSFSFLFESKDYLRVLLFMTEDLWVLMGMNFVGFGIYRSVTVVSFVEDVQFKFNEGI